MKISKTLNALFAFLLLLIPSFIFSQTPKKYCETAEKFEKVNNFTEAVTNYSMALAMDATYEKAYVGRAFCYEKLDKKQEALDDYVQATIHSPKNKENFYNAGRLLSDLQKYADADQMLRKAIEKDNGYSDAIEKEVFVLLKLKDFHYGLIVTQIGIDDKKSAQNYYNRAVMYDSLNNFEEAERYYKSAKSSDSRFIPAYVGLALTQVKMEKVDDAMKICEDGLSKDPENSSVLFAKSIVSAAKKDYQNAINDITKVILTNPSPEALKQRAIYYETLGQQQNAISDYSQIIKIDANNIDAYLKRAYANEKIQNIKAAVEDYNSIRLLSKGNPKADGIVQQANAKIFELNKETDKPEIEFTTMKSDKNVLRISADKNDITIKGKVKDASLIKSMNVSSGIATFDNDSINPEFVLKITGLNKLNEVTISATDVYNNTQISQYKIEKTESDKPIIAIETPITSFENEIFIDNKGDVYMQGKIKDASLIESIIIDGITASFNPTMLNPEFSATLKIEEKSKINITVKDIYGNENSQDYVLNRSGLMAGIDNPMGNTWVVFIENSKYLSFPSLEGPSKDVIAMKSALANYRITKTLTQKDMTKVEMEKFFSITLRDYVKNNNINSLLIWYAGHGKYVSPTGYWVPSDGKTDDEFSYFGINNLKAAMQSYVGKLVHTLVITDACESGATFLMAMRGGDSEKHCDNFELTKAKSAQVFTSAGYELASDNSQFTKTFSSTLINNVEPCLPIEKISKKVITAVSAAGNQAPKFGKIKDLEDEGGTFFFIKK